MKDLALIIVVAGFLTGCGNSGMNSSLSNNSSLRSGYPPFNSNMAVRAPEFWISLPALANKTAEEVEKTTGKATQTSIISEPAQEVPGELRTYDLLDMKKALSIRFYKGKAVAFTITIPAQRAFKTPEEVGKMAGFDLTGKTPAKTTEFVSQWNGEFGKVRFEEVAIGKTAKTDYNSIRARIQQ
jgi:hypothetical protein